ncbi:hypothetical protein Pcinc_001339 [Petrolisthes cinctipes]|uniref:Uncharacterized protein n=1 Tax=Petrolisthes cinctipes TaxID=88211 RepID=A0AAE1L3C9_PETCI|nr:hypothetical protein Pcinc_001339 [Petrolisthes cinctipes]
MTVRDEIIDQGVVEEEEQEEVDKREPNGKEQRPRGNSEQRPTIDGRETVVGEWTEAMMGKEKVEGRKGEAGIGMGETERGMGETERGMGETDRGMGETERGMGEAERGMREAERGMGETKGGKGETKGGKGEAGRGMGETEKGMREAGRGMGETKGGKRETERGIGETKGGKGETERGMREAGRGMGDTKGEKGETERGIGETERGMGEAGRGMGETKGGKGETERGMGETKGGKGEAERREGEGGETKEDLSTFEDLLQAVIGQRGRWNYLLFFICSYGSLLPAMQTMSYQVLGATPDYWCHVDQLLEANWTTQQILHFAIPFNNKTRKHEGCQMYDYNYTTAVVMGYDEGMVTLTPNRLPLVPCQHRDYDLSVYKSTITTEWDLVCERRAMYSTTQAATQIGQLAGFFLLGYIMDMSWKWLQAALSLPCLVLIAHYWLLPESPRWLVLQGRYDEALKLLKQAANMNGNVPPSDGTILTAMHTIYKKEPSTKTHTGLVKILCDYVAILRLKKLRIRALIIFGCWFICALVYYGVSLNATNLSTDVYLYMFLGGLLEVPSYVLLWPAIAFFGRVKSLAGLFFMCGVSILIVACIIFFLPEGECNFHLQNQG